MNILTEEHETQEPTNELILRLTQAAEEKGRLAALQHEETTKLRALEEERVELERERYARQVRLLDGIDAMLLCVSEMVALGAERHQMNSTRWVLLLETLHLMLPLIARGDESANADVARLMEILRAVSSIRSGDVIVGTNIEAGRDLSARDITGRDKEE